MIVEVNELLTRIEDLELDKYPEEILELFWDFINNVPYIKYLISSSRPYAKDLPRLDGRIIVDITKPHILENMDYFRLSAITFLKTGRYTNLRPNPNPNSEYGKWIREEVRRCYDGYVRESDGEWITGDMYYFLNYCPMQLIEKEKGAKIGKRVVSFPRFWEGHYYLFHYLLLARLNGNHAFMLASRARGKSFIGAGLLSKRFELGESKEVNKKVICYITASDKKYLQGGDLTLDKFVFNIDHCALHTQFPSRKLVNSLNKLEWVSGYKDLDTETNRGTLNAVIGVSSANDESKLRGTRGVLYVLEEMGTFPKLLDLYGNMRHSVEQGGITYGTIFAYGCVCAGTKVWTLDGKYINIENLQKEDGIVGCSYDGITKEPIGTIIEPKLKECLRITLSNKNILECSTDHPILTQIKHSHRISNSNKRTFNYEEGFVPANSLKIGDRICEARTINIFGNDVLFDARLVGLLIGDGSYGFNNTPKYCSEDKELLEYIKTKYKWSYSRRPFITKKDNIYEEIRVNNICRNLREVGIYGLTKENKRLPINYLTLDKNNTSELLGGLFDTDGCVLIKQQNSEISLTQSNKEILELIKILLRKYGIVCSIIFNKPSIKEGRKDKKGWYRLGIKGRVNITNFYNNITFLVKSKLEKLNAVIEWFNNNPSTKPVNFDTNLFEVNKIVKIENIGIQTIYNLSAVGTHTYLANNIITHNTAGDNDSDFSSALEIMYNPDGYNVYSIDNVYDKEGLSRKKFVYFFPGYMNYEGFYDINGNSDVTGALLELLKDRYKVKYNSLNVNAITKRIAESPVVPLEAVLRARGNMFPITLINERIALLDNNPNSYDDVYVGDLVLDKDNTVKYVPTNETPIHDFPLKDNTSRGAIEFFALPEKNREGKITVNRYIGGLDPYDNDLADSMSLGSFFILDLFTDRIVCEYTGRTTYADELYEKFRLALIFYNAKGLYESNKKGTFAYFSRMNSTHLLADTPEYLRDKLLIKYSSFGSNQKGVNASLAINNYANGLIKDWLIKPVPTIIKEDNEDKEITISNLYFIKNRALLKELVLFNPEINVDRIRALGMVMLYREEFMILYQGDMRDKDEPSSQYLGNDSFFTKNYNSSKFSKM